jgi:predicted metalloprotease with PDZ domain
VLINAIKPGGPADAAQDAHPSHRLMPGDEVIAVNSVPVVGFPSTHTLARIQSASKVGAVEFEVARVVRRSPIRTNASASHRGEEFFSNDAGTTPQQDAQAPPPRMQALSSSGGDNRGSPQSLHYEDEGIQPTVRGGHTPRTQSQVHILKIDVQRGLGTNVAMGSDNAGGSTVFAERVMAGTRADECGLQANDRLLSINGHSLAAITLDEAVELLGAARGRGM